MHASATSLGRLLLLAALVSSQPAGVVASGEAPPLIARWSFDEASGAACADASGGGNTAMPEARNARGFERVPGVFGNALSFGARHLLRVPGKPEFGELKGLTLCAWVTPAGFEVYNEIFRKEDGEQRVLFSFQERGTILSLGLNINGYVECDAPIKPEQLLDGRWHHCAATFDGRFMRVYLDGREIGQLERPGVIQAGGAAPGCIGSANGGECFQGELDEVRLHRGALTAEAIAQLCEEGLQALARASESADAGEPQLNLPLLAWWKFNERSGASMVHDTAGNPRAEVKGGAGVRRARGVYGHAALLRGQPRLSTVAGLGPARLARLSFSAWVKPAELSGFREIFRQECENRVLFSFQESGTVLSFGLNVGGYEECDARIEPARLLDGRWHHCAATFDGQFMRVYVDGQERGRLARPGGVALDARAPCFLGSSGGLGEFFQGALDDLRIYAEALSPQQVAALHGRGLEALQGATQAVEGLVRAVYPAGRGFAETVAQCRKNTAEQKVDLTDELADALAARLQAAFADECARFVAWTGASVMEYLACPGNEFQMREAGRLVELLLEYKPLTEAQWKKQTPEDRRKWEQAEAVARRYEKLKAEGKAAQFAPDWLTVMLEAGEQIQLRPRVSEAVAPYVRPETPSTRTLTAEEARAALERDWLHQVGGQPSVEHVRNEIGWTRQLAQRLVAQHRGAVSFAAELAQLTELEKQAAAPIGPATPLYFQVRALKRAVLFRNPVVDFDRVLLVDMPFPQGSEWPHETRHRLGYMAVPGGRLLVLEGLEPGGRLRQLMPEAPLHGSFWRPDVSRDARRVLFCFKPHNEKSFHLYEIDVDGTGLRQLTDGPFDDLDPVYLPDGHILFSTTRGHTYVRCMPPTSAYVLARCERDGRNIYLVSQNNEPDYLPSVMEDGRVIYTRWEYTDKPLWRAQKLWTMNPDGTQVSMFWGNQSVWPDLLKDARNIPGSQRVMFTGSAHHNWFSGSVGIIDPDRGLNFPSGLTKVTADVSWPECGNGPVDPLESSRYHASGHYPAYYSPYPLSEQDFLVSAQRGGRFMLYLMDVDGNRELIYEGLHNIFHALPLRPRALPPVLADRVDWPDPDSHAPAREGVLFSNNVYQNAPPELRGKARYLRVLHIEPKTYTYWHKRPYISTGPVVSMVQSEGVKRVLGTVPIEADGSVAFHAPAGLALHFQLLDEKFRALQTMRSFVGVMPGEYRGCLGCHESHSRAPAAATPSLALQAEPRAITPPPWGEDTVSYGRYVQPVLDKYCSQCHQGEGEARQTLDLTMRPGFLMFCEPYVTLTGSPSWGVPYVPPPEPPPGWGIAGMLMVEGYSQTDPAAYRTPRPMTALSYKSRLIEIAGSGSHHDVKVDEVSLQRLIAWVDAMCPYNGDEEVRAEGDPVFQGVDWLSVRPRIATAPRIARPGPVRD